MPINVNLSPDRGMPSTTLMNRGDGMILRNIANYAFPGRINSNTKYYGHEDRNQLEINGGQSLNLIYDYLLENNEVKPLGNKSIKIYINLGDESDEIDLVSSSSDSDVSLPPEGMKKKRKSRKSKTKRKSRKSKTKRKSKKSKKSRKSKRNKSKRKSKRK